jgi:hypothetical protein
VFAADFAIPVAMAIVETCLAHAALHCARSRQHPPAGIKWQLTRAREIMLRGIIRTMTGEGASPFVRVGGFCLKQPILPIGVGIRKLSEETNDSSG